MKDEFSIQFKSVSQIEASCGMDSFKLVYNNFLKHEKLEADPSQLELAAKLNTYAYLINSRQKQSCALFRFLSFKKKPTSKFCGMYIWGGVGRGKSLMLNLFCDSLTVKAKKRMHFHEFMACAHRSLDELRKTSDATDHVKQYASDLARRYKTLILDELQINNIADAMIVGRLFPALIEEGVFVFLASNRIPVDLFKDGLQRELFLPFIDVIQNKLEVFNLDNAIDYRLHNLKVAKTYLYPLNDKNEDKIESIIKKLTGNQPLYEQRLTICENHTITAFHSYGHMAVFTFKELCEVALGVLDYLALCARFNLIIIKNIKQLTPSEHNELLRFITLIDCLYDRQIKLICLSDCKIEDIYREGKHAFEFQRTISRLKEMHTEEYFGNTSK